MESNRRKFIKKSVVTASGLLIAPQLVNSRNSTKFTMQERINIVGPKEGFTPQIGTLVSMLNWMRDVVIRSVRGLSTKELDYLHDNDANSIGSMLWHLAAIERFYQRNTLQKQWDGLSSNDSKKWSAASSLGQAGRRQIKGYSLDFYINLLDNVRQFSIDEFKKRDDKWLMKVDNNFWSSPTNNYCKWFHVCEHESNHNGQIKWIKSRIS